MPILKKIISVGITSLMLFGASPFSVARAVVTQTRLAREVEGFPTTFDSKELTIDSAFLINEYGNGAQPPAAKPEQYNRWTYLDDVVASFNAKYPGENLTLQNLDWDFGTYTKKTITGRIMYSPLNQQSYAIANLNHTAYESKMGPNGRTMQSVLGHPLSDAPPVLSPESAGTRQDFIGGSIFLQIPSYMAVPMPFKLVQFYDEQKRLNLDLGFPVWMPFEVRNVWNQNFSSGWQARWDTTTDEVTLSDIRRKYRCEDYSDADDTRLSLIGLHGIVDSGIEFLDESGRFLQSLIAAILNPFETKDALVAAIAEFEKADLSDFMSAASNAALDALKQEYDSTSCNARRMYVSGRIMGTAMTFFMPTQSLNIAEKLKATRWAKALAKVDPVAKWLAYVSQTTRSLQALAQRLGTLNFFSLEQISHVILGGSDEVTGKFLGEGLHSAKTLKNAMDSGMIEVWDKTKTHRFKRFKDIATDENGVRDVNILKENGKFAPKSLFPESWSEEDIISAIIEASGVITNTGFSKIVTRKGITIKVDGYFLADWSISTGFPHIPGLNP